MCNRYVCPTLGEIKHYWELSDAQIRNWFSQTFNASRTALVPILRLGEAGTLELVGARGGVIPFWWTEANSPLNTFNARTEEAATIPRLRHPAAKARCLIPAVGWYEWKEVERVNSLTGEVTNGRQPYFIRRQDAKFIAFAGLMWRRTIEGDKSEFTCSILTRDAVGPAAEVYTRMPIALTKDTEGRWLDPSLTDAVKAIELARESAVTHLVYYDINPRMAKARNESVDFIEPFENPA